jgi:quercetin dioxygenase-like cupin family protein
MTKTPLTARWAGLAAVLLAAGICVAPASSSRAGYEPGGKSGEHHHAGSVFAYALSGVVRAENSAAGPAKVYQAGESFFEPPGSEHLISGNASTTEPATLLAIFVTDERATLTTFDP